MPNRADSAILNVAQGFGGPADPLEHLKIKATDPNTPRLDKFATDALMREWGCRKFVEALPKEATLKPFDIEIDGRDDDAMRVKDRMDELCVLDRVQQALIWDRKDGASALFPVLDGAGEIATPLDLKRQRIKIRRIEPLARHVDLHDPMIENIIHDIGSPDYGRVFKWQIGVTTKDCHASRIHVYQGWAPTKRHWPNAFGLSILETFFESWATYGNSLRAATSGAGRIGETRIGYDGWRHLHLTQDDAAIDAIQSQAQRSAIIRSALRVLIHDKADEVTDAQITLTGLPEIVRLAREDVAGASGFTAQRFFGLAHEGMSDNDETGQQRDEAVIAEYRRKRVLPAIDFLMPFVLADLGLKDVDEWKISFPPLREETPGEHANRWNTKMQAAVTGLNAGILGEDEVRKRWRQEDDCPYDIGDEDFIEPRQEDPMDDDLNLEGIAEDAQPTR